MIIASGGHDVNIGQPLFMDLRRFIPGFVQSHLAGRTVVQRVLGNSGWMFADQLWRMFLSLAVGVWVARYLGPSQFGQLSYALAFVALASPLAGLGLSGLLVRDFVRDRGAAGEMLGTAAMLKGAAGLCVLVGCVASAWVLDRAGSQSLWLVMAVASGPFFQGLDSLDAWLQAEDRYLDSSVAKTAAATIVAVTKVGLVLAHAPLLAFAVTGVLEAALCGLGWWVAWRRGAAGTSRWRWSTVRARAWLGEAWPLIVSGVAIQVQAQADQVLIGRLLPAEELGQYSAAIRLVAALAFVPMVLQAAAAPEIARAKVEGAAPYRLRLHRLYRAMMLGTVVLVAPLVLFPHLIVRLLLGRQFGGAAVLLPVLAFRLVLTGFGVARSLFIANEGLFRFSMISSVAGAGVSVALNFWLIPRWGLWGAIAASFVSLTITTFVVDAIVPSTRGNCRLMLRALVMPWRSLQR